jgi:hypothetical protein
MYISRFSESFSSIIFEWDITTRAQAFLSRRQSMIHTTAIISITYRECQESAVSNRNPRSSDRERYRSDQFPSYC